MMHEAVGVSAYLAKFPLVDAFRDDGFGGVPARLELRSRSLFFGLGFSGRISVYLPSVEPWC
jgi:hypothetical protein